MSDCEWLSDRMPMVALGQADWTPDEIRHLNECEACGQEWELVQVTSRLGEGAGRSLDPAAIAAGVLRRLSRDREAARLRRRGWGFAGLAAAAALVAAIWIGAPEKGPGESRPQGTLVAGRLSIPLPELDSLEPAELDSVLQTMDEPMVSGSMSDDPALSDLNSDELESVLNSWEG